MSQMRDILTEMLDQEGMKKYVVDSFEAAKNNKRRKNIVLTDEGIYLTFKANVEGKTNVFGELACWVDDEFKEDPSVYDNAINAVIDLYTYSDKELNKHIVNDDLIEIFTAYDKEIA